MPGREELLLKRDRTWIDSLQNSVSLQVSKDYYRNQQVFFLCICMLSIVHCFFQCILGCAKEGEEWPSLPGKMQLISFQTYAWIREHTSQHNPVWFWSVQYKGAQWIQESLGLGVLIKQEMENTQNHNNIIQRCKEKENRIGFEE